MFDKYKVIAFVSTAQPVRARTFYHETLGLRLLEDTPFVFVFAAGTTMLRVSKVQRLTLAPYTVLGWKVPDVRATVTELVNKGVIFERYDTLSQDDSGVWTSPRRAPGVLVQGS